MIDGLSQQGKYMYIHGGHDNGPYVSMSTPSAGMMRYNGDNRKLEVYNGSTWLQINGSIASVGLSPVAEEAIDWVRRQMEKEKQFFDLAKTSKAVKLALDNVEQAKAELQILAELARTEYEQTTT